MNALVNLLSVLGMGSGANSTDEPLRFARAKIAVMHHVLDEEHQLASGMQICKGEISVPVYVEQPDKNDQPSFDCKAPTSQHEAKLSVTGMIIIADLLPDGRVTKNFYTTLQVSDAKMAEGKWWAYASADDLDLKNLTLVVASKEHHFNVDGLGSQTGSTYSAIVEFFDR